MSAASIIPQHHRFVKALAQALRRRCGLAAAGPGGPGRASEVRLLVAVSGGADSVALLRGLAAIAPRRDWRLKLAVGHVQHHLRPQAEADAAFVAALADRLDLPLLRADLNLTETTGVGGTGRGGRSPRNLEARARAARYRALATMARAFGAARIVTAHQADDQLETLLMRLLRGASMRGLGGMAWRRRLAGPTSTPGEGTHGEAAWGGQLWLLRPMLAVDRAGVQEFLRDIGQPWCEDHTNADVTRFRARLRQDVLPVLRDIRPDVATRAVATTEHLRQVARLMEDAVDAAADRVLFQEGQAIVDRVDARTLPGLVLAGLMRRLLSEAGVPADRLGQRTLSPIVRAVRDATGGRRRFDLGRGVSVVVERLTVRVRGR